MVKALGDVVILPIPPNASGLPPDSQGMIIAIAPMGTPGEYEVEFKGPDGRVLWVGLLGEEELKDPVVGPVLYRKKHSIYTVKQWHTHGDHPNVLTYEQAKAQGFWEGDPLYGEATGYLSQEDGTHLVFTGDWILTDDAGSVHVRSKASFEEFFEPVPGGLDA